LSIWHRSKAKIALLRENKLAQNTLWMSLGNGIGLVLKAGYFLAITRCLGSHQYGAFVATTALVAVLAPYATLGTGNLLIKNVARDRSVFGEYWGNCLFMACISGFTLLLIVLGVARLLLPKDVSILLVFLVALSDLIFARLVDASVQCFQAFEMLKTGAQLTILVNGCRLFGAVILIGFITKPSAQAWACFYLAASFVAVLRALTLVNRRLGRPRLALWRIPAELREGCYFSVSLSAQTINNDIDKTMLARLSTLDAAGIYAAAYRLIDVSFVPVKSLLFAAYARFFRHGSEGIQGSNRYAKQLSPRSGAYGIVVGVALFLLAPLVPHVLGPEYARTTEALRWLAALPFLKSLHFFFADSLTGAGYQGLRTLLQGVVAAFNVGLNLWLIPAYSWRGAAWASLASDGMLLVVLFSASEFLCRRHARRMRMADDVAVIV
jgi:O-antigen/teichoic acid export membrane protein